MGCDIHMAVEVRRNGKWERALPPEHARVPCEVEEARRGDPWSVRRAEVEWFTDRRYALFGALAGVRNYDVSPIAEPRGLPNDVSEEVRKLATYDYDNPGDVQLGDHSFTWLTLDEVLAYDWNQKMPDGAPLRDWCGDFFTRFVPALKELDADPRNVRLVFGFDN